MIQKTLSELLANNTLRYIGNGGYPGETITIVVRQMFYPVTGRLKRPDKKPLNVVSN
jgi:hypothetical protein